MEKTLAPLEIRTRKKPVKQLWLIDLAAVFMELDRKKEAETVMALSDLGEAGLPPDFRHGGAAPRLNPRRTRQALPILERLCRTTPSRCA